MNVAGVILALKTTPVPDNATVPKFPTVRVPVRTPVVLGVKATLIVQEMFTANVDPQVPPGCVKLPLIVMTPTVMAAPLALLSVTV